MYYEERIIGGALHYRLNPDAEWTLFSREELTLMLTSARHTVDLLARFGRTWMHQQVPPVEGSGGDHV